MSPAAWRATVLAAIVGARSAPAQAQVPLAEDRNPTDGVGRIIHDYSGEGDASSIELNPALVGDVKGLDLTAMGYWSRSDFTRGGGFGGFAAANLGFGLAAGLGVQIIRPQLRVGDADFDATNNPDLTKLSFALAGDAEQAAFGIGVHGVRREGRRLQRPDLDIGALIRIFNYGSLGIRARLSPIDIDRQELPGHLSLTTELALRPLGTRHLELAGGATQQLLLSENQQPARRVDFSGFLPRGRIAVRWHGWALHAEVEQVRVSALDPTTLERVRGQKALRGGVSLAASWDVLTVSAGAHAGLSEGIDGLGFSARLHSRSEGRVFWPRLIDAERIDLAAVHDDRDVVRILQRLERARLAGERSVIVVDANEANLGWASLHELRQALVRVRNAGGHVYAYLEDATMPAYYLASVAEHIYVHPAGALQTYGLASSSLYFKQALDTIGVRAEVIKIDEYKSAGEPFAQPGPSDADRSQRQALQRDTYAQIVHDVAQARQRSLTEIRHSFDQSPWGPEDAVTEGLVDEVIFRDELLDSISDRLGATVEFASFVDSHPDQYWSEAPYIAVVMIDGSIVDGQSRTIPFLGTNFTGGDTIVKTLRSLRNDRDCRGIVLRVNSPGGSALASDIMWREVQRTADQHQQDPQFSAPIVVSMSDVAASGGYYVAMGAPMVFADPLTITGSIGVISIHFDISGLLAMLGINEVSFTEGPNGTIGSLFRPYTDDQRQRIEASIRRTYDLFCQRVASARGMTLDKVDELGRGHVYSGTDAHTLGLVDRLGGLHEAITEVRERSGVPPWRSLEVRVVPSEPTLVDIILNATRGPQRRPGRLGQAIDRRRRHARHRDARPTLPLALDQALSRLPLSLLFIPQGRAHAIAPHLVTLQ